MSYNITNEIKKMLSADQYNALDKNALNHNMSLATDVIMLNSDYKKALFALHLQLNDSFSVPTSAEAGDVSVSLDNSWLDALPPALRPLLMSLQNTPYGQKLLSILMLPSNNNSNGYGRHVGGVDSTDLWRCPCCCCNVCCC